MSTKPNLESSPALTELGSLRKGGSRIVESARDFLTARGVQGRTAVLAHLFVLSPPDLFGSFLALVHSSFPSNQERDELKNTFLHAVRLIARNKNVIGGGQAALSTT